MLAGMTGLAGWGACHGFENGVPSAKLPPGLEAAALEAVWACLIFFWVALPAGAVIGGLAGFGSWLVKRPEARA